VGNGAGIRKIADAVKENELKNQSVMISVSTGGSEASFYWSSSNRMMSRLLRFSRR
jgi:putative NADPH-quinone reductase